MQSARAAARGRHGRRAPARPGRRRSGRRGSTRNAAVGLRVERVEERGRARPIRPTVATTRSNDGEARGTRRRLRDVRARALSSRCSSPSTTASRTSRSGGRAAPSARPSRDLELVVVDDASVDATPELARTRSTTRRVRVAPQRRAARPRRRAERGLDAASGTYVARIDADDVALPRGSRRRSARLRAASESLSSARG